MQGAARRRDRAAAAGGRAARARQRYGVADALLCNILNVLISPARGGGSTLVADRHSTPGAACRRKRSKTCGVQNWAAPGARAKRQYWLPHARGRCVPATVVLNSHNRNAALWCKGCSNWEVLGRSHAASAFMQHAKCAHVYVQAGGRLDAHSISIAVYERAAELTHACAASGAADWGAVATGGCRAPLRVGPLRLQLGAKQALQLQSYCP